MEKKMSSRNRCFCVVAGFVFFALTSGAATVITESQSTAYTVATGDLLQTHRSDTEFMVNLYQGGGNSLVVDVLTDGTFGAANSTGTYTIANGTVTYTLDTTYQPEGHAVSTVNTYTGWNDTGRINQKYTVSFRKVGTDVFSDAVTVDYVGTASQTFVSIADLNLTGVDAVRFTFPQQQNGGVGYKEIDVIGPAPTLSYTLTGENNGTGWPVSNSDLLQARLASTDNTIVLHTESNYTNEGVPALTNGVYGTPAVGKSGTCGIRSGTLTYNLDLDAHPAGYSITDIDTYAGWQDPGRDNQNYTVSFRRAGSEAFVGAISALQEGTISQTHIKLADLGLTGVAAIRFSFPWQENGGVGYREIDVAGEAPDYFDVSRLDSGRKVITNDAAAVVRIVEGTGTPGDITLEAQTNMIRTLCQEAATGAAVIAPEGRALALDGIVLPAGAGGLTIGAGTLIPQQVNLSLANTSSGALVIDAAIVNGRGNASYLTKTGSGTVILNGTNSYGGTTLFSGGVLEVGSLSNYGVDGGLGNRARDCPRNVGLLFRGGTLRYAGSTPQSTDRSVRINADWGGGRPGSAVIDASGSVPSATLSFTATTSADFFENSGTRSLTLTGSNTGNNLFGIALSEAGGATTLIKSGSGTWATTGANAYNGGTLIREGTLKSNAVGSGPVQIAADATWDAGVANHTVAGLSGSGNVVRTWGQVTMGSNGEALISPAKSYVHLLDFGSGSGATVNGVTFAGIDSTSGTGWSLNGTPGLYNESSGTSGYAQLVSDFRYNGTPGVLTFSDLAVGQLYTIVLYTQVGIWGTRPQNATFVNGTDEHHLFNTEPGNYGYYSFRFVAKSATASVAMQPLKPDSFHWFAASLETEGPVPLTVGDGGDHLFAGVISGPTTLIKQGSGRLTLSGANTYGGHTAVNAGTLEITKDDALPAGTSVAIASGAGMMLNNPGTQIVTALALGGEPAYTGTWGAPGSHAEHKSAVFEGTGVLKVLTGPATPGTIMLLR